MLKLAFEIGPGFQVQLTDMGLRTGLPPLSGPTVHYLVYLKRGQSALLECKFHQKCATKNLSMVLTTPHFWQREDRKCQFF